MNLVLNACRGFGEDNPFLQCDIDKQDNSTYALCVHYQEQGNVGGKYERLEFTCGRLFTSDNLQQTFITCLQTMPHLADRSRPVNTA